MMAKINLRSQMGRQRGGARVAKPQRILLQTRRPGAEQRGSIDGQAGMRTKLSTAVTMSISLSQR